MREKDINFKVRDFVLGELRFAMDNPKDAVGARQRAFGVVFFASNNLFSKYNEELADWWDKDILPMFDTIIRRGY